MSNVKCVLFFFADSFVTSGSFDQKCEQTLRANIKRKMPTINSLLYIFFSILALYPSLSFALAPLVLCVNFFSSFMKILSLSLFKCKIFLSRQYTFWEEEEEEEDWERKKSRNFLKDLLRKSRIRDLIFLCVQGEWMRRNKKV